LAIQTFIWKVAASCHVGELIDYNNMQYETANDQSELCSDVNYLPIL